MKTLLILLFCSSMLGVFNRVVFLSAREYPRSTTYKAWHDVVSLLENVGMAVLVSVLLGWLS